MEKIKKVIHKNFKKPGFNVNNLSDKMGITYSTLYEKFKKEINIPPKQYLENKRLGQALLLMAGNNHSLCEICFLSGYDNTKTFRRIIKRRLGKNPSQLKKEIGALAAGEQQEKINKMVWGCNKP